ncbi:hypothetical protein GCM10009754_49290 [Amycolatopsis minnesotensis]|uniref:Metalloprotease n=1 Tax=Amycolatopsis minnesotensis TaxID=337894 RepID=A0ABN2RIL1_9PSEU
MAKLADNPLFADSNYGLQNKACQLARWSNNESAAAAFMESAKPCLDAVWAPVMSAAGLPFKSPGLQSPSGKSWSSPCGSVEYDNIAAFYCPKNQTLYMPYAGLRVENGGAHPGIYLAVFAHEYGHHVQNLSGIEGAADEQRYNAGQDSSAGLEVSRRLELQAQCFSGMFLGSATNHGGSIDQQMLNEAWNSNRRGDDHGAPQRDHGSDDHSEGWWRTGSKYNRNQRCNTWASSSKDVA